jgi:hypothetical protein
VRRPALAAAAAAALALAGCPLPQPLPDYPAGTTIPAPRILVDGIQIGGVSANGTPVVLVPAGCGSEPTYALSARIFDTNTIEQVEARWFVNYYPRSDSYNGWHQSDVVLPDPDPLVLTRSVPPRAADGSERPFVFRPYQYPPPAGVAASSGPTWPEAGFVRVVEVVVSNGFDPDAVSWPAADLPNRTPALLRETQVYRWVFLSVPAATGTCDPASDPACVKCP